MYLFIIILQTLMAGVFGWFIGELAGKCDSGKITNFKQWKAWALELLFIGALYTSTWLGEYRINNKVYNTKEYEIETVDSSFDSDSTEVYSFKVVKR